MLKKNDFYTLLVIIVIASTFSVILSRLLFKVETSKTKVEVVKKIDDNFPLPPPEYFNSDSLNPTQLIKIDSGENQKPFNQKP